MSNIRNLVNYKKDKKSKKQPSIRTKVSKNSKQKRKKSERKQNKNKQEISKYYTLNELYDNAIVEGSLNSYNNVFNKFKIWLKYANSIDKSTITFDQLIECKNLFKLNYLLQKWIEYEFNETHNTGDTIRNKIYKILHCLGRYGFHVSGQLLPGITKICKGINRTCQKLGIKVRQPKYNILYPMLRAMFKHATKQEQFMALVAHSFCLRSEHYVYNVKKDYLRVKHFRFLPSIDNPTQLSIKTGNDKNHQFGNLPRDRTCSCVCKTLGKDLCVVHVAQEVLYPRRFNYDEQATLCESGNLNYDTANRITKKLIKAIGLDDSNYSTHGYRGGGTTEMYLNGYTMLQIQQHVYWESLQSILAYIRPNNPDLIHFGHTSATYETTRRNQENDLNVVIDQSNDDNTLQIVMDIKKNMKKKNHLKKSVYTKYETWQNYYNSNYEPNARCIPWIPPLETFTISDFLSS